METKFQTTFIPKKQPLMPQQNQSGHTNAHAASSILMLVATILFIVSIGGAGFTFFAKSYLLQEQEQYKKDLIENENRFNTPLIQDLKRANEKIDLAKRLVGNHLAVSESLSIVAALTAERVYFDEFQFIAPPEFWKNATNGAYMIKMKGVADSFNSIAFQSKVFGTSQTYGRNKVLKNPILSDLTVDDKGNVKFNFDAEISLDDISYDKVLTSTLQSEGLITDDLNSLDGLDNLDNLDNF